MMTLRQLRYLVAVADALNFRRAAEACCVTQPALTAQIQELEQRLGVQLLERNKQRVLLTRIGEQVVAHARRILTATDDLQALARQGARPLSGPLRLGVIPTVGPYLLPDLLPAVRAAYPELKLYLQEDRTARLLEALAAGRLELLLLALPVEAQQIETMPLFDEPFLVAMAQDHPLTAAEAVREADLKGESVLLLEEGHCLREQALAVCRLAGANEPVELQATSLNTLVQMVANGIGLTLLPRMAAAVELRAPTEVALRPFAAPVPTRRIGLVWRRSSARAEDYRRLGTLLLEAQSGAAGAGLNPPRRNAARRRAAGDRGSGAPAPPRSPR